jgi:hypothetical protein
MRSVLALLILQLTAAGCHRARYVELELDAGVGANPDSDRDQDRLCDDTEAMLGTDPNAFDTDLDAWPDVVEAITDSNPQDPSSPRADEVVYLQPGGTVDFNVAATVVGNGEGATGEFRARNAFDARGRRASDYYQGATAIGADPPDNVRGIQADAVRFDTVSGKTRLRFRLQFGFTRDENLACSAALPFEYRVKGDVGGYLDSHSYLLVVTPARPKLDAQAFCLPVACL